MARVLLIDDNQPNVEFMRQFLRLLGHELVWAADGSQGLELVQQFHPDLIILDVIMPHLGGYAVLETVRADPQCSDTPIILFSVAMNEEWRAIGLRRGANEVLGKPFDLEMLRAAVSRCLGQAQP